MNKQQHWQKSLAKGIDFERDVAGPLISTLYPNHLISRVAKDPKNLDGIYAYRGAKRQERFVLPDFQLFDKTNQEWLWIDSKYKEQPFSGRMLSRPNEKAVSLDATKHQQYIAFLNEYPGKLYFLFGIGQTKKIYLGDWNPNPEMVIFNNQYNNGPTPTPVYYINDMQLVGAF